MVRARAALAPRRLRALADLPGRPRAALRRRRVDDRHRDLPVRRHGQDQRPARGRRGSGALGVAAAARRQLRPRPGRGAGAGRRDRDAGVRQHPRPAALHLRPGRRVRPRLQLRRQEHPRPHVPVRRAARRRRHPRTSRGQGLPAARQRRGRRLRGHVRRPHRRRRRARGRAPHPDHPLRAPGAGGGHVRDDVPAAPQPHGVPRPERGARHPVLRQRRPAGLRDERGPRRPGPRPGAQHRARHHQRHPGGRRRGRRRRVGARPLHRGRGLPGLRRLARRDRQGPRHARPGVPVRLPEGRRGPDRRRRLDTGRRPRRPARARLVDRDLDAAARHGPRRPRRRDAPQRGPPRGRLDDRDVARLLRGRAREHARDRRPARRHVRRQPAVVGEARDHRAPARRRPHGPARGGGAVRRVRRGVRPPRPVRAGRRAAARPRRRQPVPDHRRRRRPRLHAHPGVGLRHATLYRWSRRSRSDRHETR